MVVTILEGQIPENKEKEFVGTYKKNRDKVPDEIVHTYLVRDLYNPQLWKIITVWKSQKDLEMMREQGTPTGVLMFRSAGVDPSLSVYELEVILK